MKLIYGVFSGRKSAEQAINKLQQHSPSTEGEVVSAAVHDTDLRNEDLPRSGNIAKRSALIGALLVGGSIGLFLALLMTGAFAGRGGPETIIGSRPLDAVLLTLAAAAFGGILAGIAGSAGNRSKIQALRGELVNGRALVTLETSRKRSADIIRSLIQNGALKAGTM
jgi:hypothetical protein